MKSPNKTDAPNAAIALLFHVGHQWRGVGDPYRSAAMEYAIAIVLVAVVALIIWASVANAARRREHRARLFAEARQFMEFVKERQALPTAATNVILKSGESAFYSAPSSLYETRAVRQYQSGSTGFRVAKGVYIGGSRGRSVSSQEWSKIDSGTLTVTNKRLIFTGIP